MRNVQTQLMRVSSASTVCVLPHATIEDRYNCFKLLTNACHVLWENNIYAGLHSQHEGSATLHNRECADNPATSFSNHAGKESSVILHLGDSAGTWQTLRSG